MESIKNTYIIADSIISSLGSTTEITQKAIENYESGVKLNNSERVSDIPMPIALINESIYAALKAEFGTSFSRLELLIIKSICNLLQQTNINSNSKELGIILSSTKGNIDLLSSSCDLESVSFSELSNRVERYFNLKNRIHIVSNACISGLSALIVGKRFIESEKYKHVIVIGCDILSHFITSGFASFKSISESVCKPYDQERNGLTLGEACGAVVLSQHYTKDSIVLAGGAISNDANHISGPSRTGYELHLAISEAMDEAQVSHNDISFINLHGTATAYNDEMESKAVNLSFLEDKPIQSLKGYLGHTLGASGVVETILSARQLSSGSLWGTIGFNRLGTPKPLKVSATHQNITMKHCIKTASGFGGCNAAIVLSLPQYAKVDSNQDRVVEKTYSTIRSVIIQNNQIQIDGVATFSSTAATFSIFIREAFKELGESYPKFYKMDNLCKLGYIAASHLLKEIRYEEENMAILLSNKSSSLDTDLNHIEQVELHGDRGVSPSIFVYTLPNVVLGEICIKFKIKGENTFFVSDKYEQDEMRRYAQIILNRNHLEYCIIGWCELLKDNYKAIFELIKRD